VAVVLGITADMAFAAANVLLGVERFPPAADYELVIFHNGVPARDLALLAQIRACHFVHYRCAQNIRRNIPGHALRAFSEMVYAKYECFELLKTYAQVIWLDTDILIRGDTTGLLERSAAGAAFAREDKPLRFNFSRDIEGFDMDRPFFNAGVFALSERLQGRESARDWLVDATVRYADRVVLGEQGILNLWLQHQGVEPGELLPEYNVFRHRPSAALARVVHAVGHHKPWMDFADPAWNADYVHWLALGGSPCPVWKSVRFMARRHPHPLRHPREMTSRAAQILRFLVRRNRHARMARVAGRPASAHGIIDTASH
jgi:lipopolysaccharide biosynthesis glycosyltransferase